MIAHANRATVVLASCAVLFFAGCAAPAPRADASDAKEEKEEKDTKQELDQSRQKLAIAELELQHATKHREEDLALKEQELALAKAELEQFEQADAPARLARERLDLTQQRDGVTEAEEELAQLAMTYAEVDVADKTREIVLSRNKRRLERAKQELELSQRELEKLESRVLPRERAKLVLEVGSHARDLESARREGELSLLQKKLALDEARAAVAKLEKAEKAEKAAPKP